MYDGIDDETFQARVDAVGPAVFTLINSLPGIAAAILLCREIVLASESPVSGALQIILAFTVAVANARRCFIAPSQEFGR